LTKRKLTKYHKRDLNKTPEILIGGGKQNRKTWWRCSGDVTVMTILKWPHNLFFKVWFCYNRFEKLNLAKSHNFRSPISKVKGALGLY